MGNEHSSLLWSGKGAGEHEKRARFVKAGFYAVQVFYSFFIMCVFSLLAYSQCHKGKKDDLYCFRLLFMTYNGWVMLAVALGAFIGYLGFGNSSATKSVACH